MRTIGIAGKTGACEIRVGEPIARLGGYVEAERKVIITDRNVRKHHGGKFPDGWDVVETGTGEESKTLAAVEKLYDRFLALELDRTSFVIGIGGGIVTDVAGYAASTYNRGMPSGFVPTTLLGQVDAAIGGKNGVNFRGYKNIVGTIRQPEFVLCDMDLLKTLPQAEVRNGLAEVVKHAAIGDAALFSWLEQNAAQVMRLDKGALEKAVYDSISVKAKAVSADELEHGERMKLNFGHTLGHAIESTQKLPHGEAVSIGMVAAAEMSVSRGTLGKKDLERLEALLKAFGLPTRIRGNKAAILDAIGKDKKRRNGAVYMALLDGIGSAKASQILMDELEGAVYDLC
jgi:3-dehydroquinate synthase